jgi:hypothetical protein
LVAASRSDHPHLAVARAWPQQALFDANQGAALNLQPMVIASFLRLVTPPKIFVHPTPVSEALRSVDALLAAPSVERPDLGAEWPTPRKLCITTTSSACFREPSSPSCHGTELLRTCRAPVPADDHHFFQDGPQSALPTGIVIMTPSDSCHRIGLPLHLAAELASSA